ncbi:MAG: hypothetical protein K8S98_03155 [Planctomycetes bacterium]|nr:hypothetical protein [Planctomycetota bacterium]
MAAEAPVQTNCPTCGAKLKRTNLSLCAYCGSPLQLGGKATTPDDEVQKRLGRLRDHAEFRAKQTWNPADDEAEAPARKLRSFASIAVVVGGLWVCAVLLRGATLTGPWAIAGYALVVLGLVAVVASRAWQTSLRTRPMLRRVAIVTDRRSDTDLERGGTTYYFSLRFHDGSEGEFRFVGRGTQYDPMANGAAGIAFTRGERLIEFHRITS